MRVPDQHHQNAAARPAADDGTRGALVNDELGYRPAALARGAGGAGRRHLGSEYVDQQAADRIAVDRVH
jgi:hypothetical protein